MARVVEYCPAAVSAESAPATIQISRGGTHVWCTTFYTRIAALLSRVTLFLLAAFVPQAIALADVAAIRPIDFGSGITATGTITTDIAGVVTDWNLTVSSFERLAHFRPGNTASKSVSQVSLSADRTQLRVATSTDPAVPNGGTLAFRSPNPGLDVGVAIADFSDTYPPGGVAMYMYGAVFDFLDLNQPVNSNYLAATASLSGVNVFSLVPLSFSGGSPYTGPSGPTEPQVPLRQTTSSVGTFTWIRSLRMFTRANSVLSANLAGWNGTDVTVHNPDGTLGFVKGYAGGHPYALQLANFSDPATPGGQAGYFQGRLAAYTVGLHAKKGAWPVTGTDPISAVPEPSASIPVAICLIGCTAFRWRRSKSNRA